MQSAKHIYSAFLLVVLLWCILILAAPLLHGQGAEARAISSLLYKFFSGVCHQFDDRSFRLAGEKLGVCIRCSSIYFSFLFGLAGLPLLRRVDAVHPPSRTLFVLAALPMALDVLLNVTGVHPSTGSTRAATGMWFGLLLPFYVVPPLVESLQSILTRITFQKAHGHD